MRTRSVVSVLAASGLLLAGFGCGDFKFNLPSFAPEVPAEDIDLQTNASLTLNNTTFAFLPLQNTDNGGVFNVKVTDWVANNRVALQWENSDTRETEASVTAREAAERSTGVGEDTVVPEPVYETLTKSGVLTTDALADGQRILLPKEWPEGENSLGGRQNTLLWLSQRQYEEIVNTRHTNIAVGSFESGLQGVQDITQMLGGLLSQVSESAGSAAANTKDVTEIEAAVDWGTYTLTYNGKKVRVRTIEAENTFATYTILANPENPLILQVELHPIALGTSALAGLGQMKTLTGYRVSVITMP